MTVATSTPNSRPPFDPVLWAAGVIFKVFVCVATVMVVGVHPFNGITVENVEKDLNEQLPDGSAWDEAEAWFASHGIQPGTITSGADSKKIGLGGEIPNSSICCTASITVEVYFSHDGKLKRRHIRRWIDGL